MNSYSLIIIVKSLSRTRSVQHSIHLEIPQMFIIYNFGETMTDICGEIDFGTVQMKLYRPKSVI